MTLDEKLRFAARVLDDNNVPFANRVYQLTASEAVEAESFDRLISAPYGFRLLPPPCKTCGRTDPR